MTTVIFRTPSKRCPFRRFNGREVTITAHFGHQRLKRSGVVQRYGVNLEPNDGRGFIAFGDELFVGGGPE